MAKARKPSPKTIPHLSILEDISTVISRSQDLQQTLRSIVAIVAERMETEVCSLYLLDRQRNRLTLCATMGLDQESVGKVSMGIDEGLTGLVIEKMGAVMVVDALAHPRYKYFPETGEERFHSFLGMPLMEGKKPLGVLVVQTSRRREFNRDEIRLVKAISNQAASIIIQARLLDSLKDKEREGKEYHKRLVDALRRLRSYEGKRREGGIRGVPHKWKGRLAGLAASPGFGRGTAFVQRLILEDPTIIEQIETKIRKERYVAEYAVSSVFEQHLQSFTQIEDEYLKERAADVRDVAQRLLENLSGIKEETLVIPREAILVADDLSPADLAVIERDRFRGIVLATGGVTSHASILAKSFEIPSVVAVDGLLESVRQGDSLIVDGNSGLVYTNPREEVIKEYDRLEREYLAFNRELDALRELPAETQDGHRVSLYANIGLLSDLTLAQLHGSQGIGLYRTEIPFLAHRDFPNEEEQYALYRRVVEGMGGLPV